MKLTRLDWLGLAFLFAMFVLFFPVGMVLQSRLAPPTGVSTLAGFASNMPAPRRMSIVNLNGVDHVVWLGETAPFPALPSGPSCYLFDANGKLVDWTTATGEGGPLDRVFNQGSEITLPEALSLVERNKP